jgi:hypothetical protein
MTPFPASRLKVFAEITRDSRAVRHEYLRTFAEEVQQFSDVMGDVLGRWLEAFAALPEDDPKRKVLSLAYVSMSLHVASMKLFLSGQQIAAGNVMRQVVESIALTFLCSSKELDILQRFDNDRYSTKNAIRDVRKNVAKLKLKSNALAALEASQEFYSKFSHPTKMTLGAFESFAGEGIYVGAAFDPGKVKHYRSEVANRLRLTKVFPSFLQTIERNLGTW